MVILAVAFCSVGSPLRCVDGSFAALNKRTVAKTIWFCKEGSGVIFVGDVSPVSKAPKVEKDGMGVIRTIMEAMVTVMDIVCRVGGYFNGGV